MLQAAREQQLPVQEELHGASRNLRHTEQHQGPDPGTGVTAHVVKAVANGAAPHCPSPHQHTLRTPVALRRDNPVPPPPLRPGFRERRRKKEIKHCLGNLQSPG